MFGSLCRPRHGGDGERAPRQDGAAFSKAEYYRAPGAFRSTFAEAVAPHATAVVHCAYWDARFPRLLTMHQLAALRS